MGCCWVHHRRFHVGHCPYCMEEAQESPPPWPYPPPPPPPRPPPRDDYVRSLEAERDMLERRLRRLEQRLDELQAGGRPREGP